MQVVNAISHLANVHKELAKAHKQASAAVLEYAKELEQEDGDKSLLATFPPLFAFAGDEAAPATKKRGRVSRSRRRRRLTFAS